MTPMSSCPACDHSLAGLAGTPTTLHGGFEADVRCPECGEVIPAGVRILVGSGFPQQVGARLERRWIIVLLLIMAGLASSAIDALHAAAIAIGRGDAAGLRALLSPGLIAIGFAIYAIVRGTVARRRLRDPDDIARAITAKACWTVRPGAIEVKHGGAGVPRSADGGGLFGAFARRFTEERIPSERIRSIAAVEVPTRRGIDGKVLHLTVRLEGSAGAAGSMYVVTRTPAAALAAELMDLLRSAPAEASIRATAAASASDASRRGIELGPERGVLRGSPFEPRFLREVTWSHRRLWLGLLAVAALLGGGIALIRSGQRGMGGLGFMMNVVGVALFVRVLYTRYRASPARWIATPGTLRIERFTRPIPWLGPSVRRIRSARLEAIRASERDGVPVLEARRVGGGAPAAILVPDDLDGRSPAEIAAAFEAIVRRPTS